MICTRHGLGLALILLGPAACEPAFDDRIVAPEASTVSLEYLRVESAQAEVTDSALTFSLEFSQPLTDAELVGHATIVRVEQPMADGRPVGSRMPVVLEGSERNWHFTVAGADTTNFGYVLVLDQALTSTKGQYLDGAVGAVSGNAGRADEDFHHGPETFISAMVGPKKADRAYAMRSEFDRPRMFDLQLYRQLSGGAAYDTFFRKPFQKIVDRADITPALPKSDMAYRLEFTAPTWLEALMDPAKIAAETRFVDALGGARVPKFSYNADYVNELQVGAPYSVTGVAAFDGVSYAWLPSELGETLEGPTLNENGSDKLYLYMGESAAGVAPLFQVTAYDREEKRLTLSSKVGQASWQPCFWTRDSASHLPR